MILQFHNCSLNSNFLAPLLAADISTSKPYPTTSEPPKGKLSVLQSV